MKSERVLFLGPDDSPLIEWLRNQGDEVVSTMQPVSPRKVADTAATFLVSYGYRHILRRPVLDLFPQRAINLHISYLPWNRGADPNFWSIAEDTPKGVTIHYLDEGIDTGDIIGQRRVELDFDSDTLATSYQKLQVAIQDLFRQNWHSIKSGTCSAQRQLGQGTSHRREDKQRLAHLLTEGWDTPIASLHRKGVSSKD